MAHTHAGSQLGAPAPHSVKFSLAVFAGMAGLMALEVVVALMRVEGSPVYNPGFGFTAMLWTLVLLACCNAFLLLTFFMNLRFETPTLRYMVMGCFCFPVLYSLVLIAESIWRHL